MENRSEPTHARIPVSAFKRLSGDACKLLAYLDWRAGKKGKCWPKQDTIARDLGWKNRHLRRKLDELREAGFIRAKRAGYGKGLVYSIPDTTDRTDAPIPDTTDRSVRSPVSAQSGHQCPEEELSSLNLFNGTSSARAHGERFGDVVCDEVFKAYPRKIKRGATLPAIRAALARIEDSGNPDAAAWLLERVRAYAESYEGQHFKADPVKWFSEGRYDDDDGEWKERQRPATHRGSAGELVKKTGRFAVGQKLDEPAKAVRAYTG